MKYSTSTKSFAAAAAALSLVTSSVVSAAPVSTSTINPLVALSVFGSPASRAALCTASAATVASSAAQAAQAQSGCVLPVVDTAPPAVVSEGPPPPVMVEPVAVTGGPNLLPLLIGLGAFAAAFFLLDDFILGDDEDDDIDFDVSPA